MNKINETVFHKPKAQDEKGLEEEAKSLLVRILDVLRIFHLLTLAFVEWERRHP
jgi:hypothetical protein